MSIYELIDNDYAVGIMFNDFRHHDIKTGKPTTKLLNHKGEHLTIDANLFWPTKNGLIITEYINGEMSGYSYLELHNGDIREIPKKPYGTLAKVKNNAGIPKNIMQKYIPALIGKGNTTWFFWKALMNSRDCDVIGDATFATLTTNQERIPNVCMVIYNK